MAKATPKSKRIPRDVPIGVAPAFHFFHFLVSLRQQLLAGTITRVACSAALVDAIAAEPDVDDWSELEVLHAQQRRVMAAGRR